MEFWLFTNRNGVMWDDKGQQVADTGVNCYAIDPVRAQECLDQCQRFKLSQWGNWVRDVSKTEMEYLLGLRSLERDLNDNKKEKGQEG